MMKRGTKFIRKVVADQGGYFRLYASLTVLATIVVSVLVYQLLVFRPFQAQSERRQAANIAYKELQLFPQSLPVLPNIFYELWVDTADNSFSLGKFQLVSSQLVDAAGETISEGIFSLPEEIENVSGVHMTISDRATARGAAIDFLAGTINNDRVVLTFNLFDPAAVTAEFTMATPTDNNSLVNEKSGIWFGDVIENEPKLFMPQAPNGWAYEGWAIHEGRTLTTGRFKNPQNADLFSGFSDVQSAGLDFPGEDFLKNPPVAVFPGLVFPINMGGQEVKITLEPDVNGVDPTGAGPFPAVIFSAEIPNRADAFQLIEMEPASQNDFPRSTVVFR